MKNARDYALEYRRRVKSAMQRGLTRQQARGHPGPNQPLASQIGKKPTRVKPDVRLEKALLAIRRGKSLSDAAREERVGRERLSTYIKRQAGAKRSGGQWSFTDTRTRRIPMFAAEQREPLVLKVPGYEFARLAGDHFDESAQVLEDQSLFDDFAERWAGVSITDINGKTYHFSTDINQLFRAHFTDELDWARIYQIYNI